MDGLLEVVHSAGHRTPRRRLEFLGFEFTDGEVLDEFRTRFSEVDAERSLDSWHVFETKNPRTFSEMYQFWVRKPEYSGE